MRQPVYKVGQSLYYLDGNQVVTGKVLGIVVLEFAQKYNKRHSLVFKGEVISESGIFYIVPCEIGEKMLMPEHRVHACKARVLDMLAAQPVRTFK